MKTKTSIKLKDGDHCKVIKGTHRGKSGIVRDINTSKLGNVTITVEQKKGVRFKTLANNVVVQNPEDIQIAKKQTEIKTKPTSELMNSPIKKKK